MVRGSPNPKHLDVPVRLRTARTRAKSTRIALAERAGISDATVRQIEAGTRVPTVGTLAKLARALGLSAAWLAYSSGEPPAAGPASCEGMGERLREAMADRGLSRTALARLAVRSPPTLTAIENGGQAGVDTVEALAKALRVSPAWLAFGIGPRELPQRRRAAASARPTAGTDKTAKSLA